MEDIYKPQFVENLFDTMSNSYDRMNHITSFGFSKMWRKQFINKIEINKGDIVADLMTGMGECWSPILSRIGNNGKIIALDFSDGMLNHAKRRKMKYSNHDIQILKENVFNNSIADNSIDVIVSGFGIKTFSSEQLKQLAIEFKRILKPDGRFSLIDISVPSNSILRFFYMFYLKNVIPILGRIFLGNPDSYRMLGRYATEFNNSKNIEDIFKNEGFEIYYNDYFYGCASGINGTISKNK